MLEFADSVAYDRNESYDTTPKVKFFEGIQDQLKNKEDLKGNSLLDAMANHKKNGHLMFPKKALDLE
jgi:hypothetical protein